MTRFTLPATHADCMAAFTDADSAASWLAGQPQANAPAMLAGLLAQIQALNSYDMPPRERFKTLEVLRKTIFAASGESLRRYENKPLPLLPVEQAAFDSVRKLWRAGAIAYLHCLCACLEHDPSIVRHSAMVAHRALACLRMEQMQCYLAGSEPDGDFWRNLHSVLACAEQLGVVLEPVEDRLLGETSESTLGGQYAMALLLHLASPFALSRGQFAAANLWFARWREQATLLTQPDSNPKSCCIALDLAQDSPIHDPLRTASVARWLSLNGVLRKMRKRLDLLAEGESPESLKLGSGLSSEACVALLNTLGEHLRFPQQPAPEASADAAPVFVASGLETIHRILGGKGLKYLIESSASGSKLSADQIAVFDHVVRASEDETGDPNSRAESWLLVKQRPGVLYLLRPAASSETRLMFKGLLAIKTGQNTHYSLATIRSLSASGRQGEGSLCITASLFAGMPVALIAELYEKPTGKLSRHPAFLLPAEGGNQPSLLIPAGLPVRALSIRFIGAREQTLGLQLEALVERGGDHERWSCTNA